MLQYQLSTQILRFASITRSPKSPIFTRGFKKLVSDLNYRGLLADLTASQENFANYLWKPRTAYCGIDPTAGSLHVGNLLPLLTLLHFQINGHRTIALLGGATALIGDPSGRDEERPIQIEEEVQANTIKIEKQLVHFFDRAHVYARKRVTPFAIHKQAVAVVNNMSWWRGLTLIDFLYSTGRHARISGMLSKESVKSRLKSSSGISFTEFCYQLLQAHDFWHLFDTHDCSIQVGGSDQWGNILAGLDMIVRRGAQSSKNTGEKALGITTPLLTTSSGQKFGKSLGNAVWLDAQKTSVFDFYQFFLRTSDADVEKYLRMFTLLTQEDINGVMRYHESQPHVRSGQRKLASEVTELIHGEAGVIQAEAATKLFFETNISNVRPEDAIAALRHDPRYHAVEDRDVLGIPITKLALSSGLVSSRADAVRLTMSGGLYLNNVPVSDRTRSLQKADLLGGRLAILRAGKDKHVILALK